MVGLKALSLTFKFGCKQTFPKHIFCYELHFVYFFLIHTQRNQQIVSEPQFKTQTHFMNKNQTGFLLKLLHGRQNSENIK